MLSDRCIVLQSCTPCKPMRKTKPPGLMAFQTLYVKITFGIPLKTVILHNPWSTACASAKTVGIRRICSHTLIRVFADSVPERGIDGHRLKPHEGCQRSVHCPSNHTAGQGQRDASTRPIRGNSLSIGHPCLSVSQFANSCQARLHPSVRHVSMYLSLSDFGSDSSPHFSSAL